MPSAQAQGKPPPPCIPAQGTGFVQLPVCSVHIEGDPDKKGTGLPWISTMKSLIFLEEIVSEH